MSHLVMKNSPRVLARSLSQKGGAALDSGALSTAIGELGAALVTVKSPLHQEIVTALARRTIRTYLSACTPVQSKQNLPGPETYALMELEVGQSMERTRNQTPSVWRDRMSTARKHMNNFGARWRIGTYDEHYIIERLPDGSVPRRDPMLNKRAVFLAELPVGMWQWAECFKDRQSMALNLKVAARRILKDDYADWTGKTINGKTFVKRIK